MAVFDVLILASIVVSSYITAGLLSATSLHTTLALIGIGFPVAALLGAPALRAADRRAAAAATKLRPRVDLLETLDLFDGIERTALERLAAVVEPRDVPVGTEIIRHGEPADALWVLVDGVLSVTVPTPATQSGDLPDVTAPGVVGELGLLHRIPRTATVSAKQASTLWRIPAENFLAVLESAPASTSLLSLAGTRMARTPGAAGT
jgi:CRP-like cAMP-binding protein